MAGGTFGNENTPIGGDEPKDSISISDYNKCTQNPKSVLSEK
jgi:hypothetical protein